MPLLPYVLAVESGQQLKGKGDAPAQERHLPGRDRARNRSMI